MTYLSKYGILLSKQCPWKIIPELRGTTIYCRNDVSGSAHTKITFEYSWVDIKYQEIRWNGRNQMKWSVSIHWAPAAPSIFIMHLRILFGFKTQYLFLQYPLFIFSSTLSLLRLAPLQTHLQTPQAPLLILVVQGWMVPALLKQCRRNKLFLSKQIRYRNQKKWTWAVEAAFGRTNCINFVSVLGHD